ncbi:hypothetical protein AB0M28_34700 [Streptomyces sp. NPDC051940]|uniref:hypothetical protein n=1 Tax=Streptomyces sp. NPDC051940 TaxID=3155675 RepID=UPI00343745D7
MSNGIAFPVLRTPDADAAVRAARSLLALGDRRFAEVWVEAVLPAPGDVLRMRAALPDGVFSVRWRAWHDEDRTGLLMGVYGRELPDDPAFLAGQVPLWFSLEDQPPDTVEDTFREQVGDCPGWLHWWNLHWPEVPEEGLYSDHKHAEVTVLFNTATAELDEPAAHHTVLVTVRRRNMDGYELRHASWLAARAGLAVVGEPHEE